MGKSNNCYYTCKPIDLSNPDFIEKELEKLKKDGKDLSESQMEVVILEDDTAFRIDRGNSTIINRDGVMDYFKKE